HVRLDALPAGAERSPDMEARFTGAVQISPPLMLGRVHRRAAGERRVGARRIRTMGLTPGSARGSRAGHARRGGVAPLRDLPVIGWLVLAGVAALLQPVLREGAWVMVHLALLGAMTYAVLVWSIFFAQALLKTPEAVDPATHQSSRQAAMIVGVACVIVGVPAGLRSLVAVGAAVVCGCVVWHGVAMIRRLRAALPSRFAVTVRYYVAASACLPVGAVFGVLLARWPASEPFGRYLIAHTMTMLL